MPNLRWEGPQERGTGAHDGRSGQMQRAQEKGRRQFSWSAGSVNVKFRAALQEAVNFQGGQPLSNN